MFAFISKHLHLIRFTDSLIKACEMMEAKQRTRSKPGRGNTPFFYSLDINSSLWLWIYLHVAKA